MTNSLLLGFFIVDFQGIATKTKPLQFKQVMKSQTPKSLYFHPILRI